MYVPSGSLLKALGEHTTFAGRTLDVSQPCVICRKAQLTASCMYFAWPLELYLTDTEISI